ncbi:hypothetical protein P4O66_012393 [Electrophorus voltai]|uniref:Uncharacterized protein n=1 Tax=Electrophorus voltai TaxID=2609070 RepID=A0AAD8Z3V1_9TELE|nr:hypothetical protein P4O66_012393 [Electrophorus voltai]
MSYQGLFRTDTSTLLFETALLGTTEHIAAPWNYGTHCSSAELRNVSQLLGTTEHIAAPRNYGTHCSSTELRNVSQLRGTTDHIVALQNYGTFLSSGELWNVSQLHGKTLKIPRQFLLNPINACSQYTALVRPTWSLVGVLSADSRCSYCNSDI